MRGELRVGGWLRRRARARTRSKSERELRSRTRIRIRVSNCFVGIGENSMSSPLSGLLRRSLLGFFRYTPLKNRVKI